MKITACLFIILFTSRLAATGQATFGGEVQRFQTVESSATTVIKMNMAIPARTVGLLAFAIEAPASMTLSSAVDSRANTWTTRASMLNNSVHQIFLVSGSLRSGLQVGDTITITFKGPIKSSRFGSLQFLSGCSNPDKPDVTISTHGYGAVVAIPVKTSAPGEIIVGVIQVDRRKSPVYTPKLWKQVGTPDDFGQSAGTVGLQNTYLYTPAPAASTYQPDGSFNVAKSWSFVAVAFK